MIKIETRKVVVVGNNVYPIIHEFDIPDSIGTRGYIINRNSTNRLVLDIAGDIKLVKEDREVYTESSDIGVLEDILRHYNEKVFDIHHALKLLTH